MRAIDGNELLKWCEKIIGQACHPVTVQIGEVFRDKVRSMPTLTPPNEPLTLEQLREMDGEPVWVTPLGFWALVIAKPGERVQLMSNDGEKVWADKEIELVGPVYRRPPEGEASDA